MPTALLIAQNDALFQSLKELARDINSLQLEKCGTVVEAQARFEKQPIVLALIHVASRQEEPGVTQFISATSQARPNCTTVVLSNEYCNYQAVAMFRAGAADYFGLPDDLKKLAYLLEVLTTRAGNGSLPQPFVAGPAPCRTGQNPMFFVLSPEIVEVMDKVRKVVAKETTLLLTGETGTGKTRLARHIHELSPRCAEPFQVVDCGALTGTLIESEMFGHTKGSFTGADRDRPGKFSAAGSGTLLLDEINALPLALQSKLLRAVDDRLFEPVGSNKSLPLNARIIAASSTPLDQEVRASRFRADLFYRLNVVGFHLPPLRERPAAIAPLANRFLAECARRNGRKIHGIAAEALKTMTAYDWPGNIRELRNVMERAVALAHGQELQVGDLPPNMRSIDHSELLIGRLNAIDYASTPMTLTQAADEAELSRITEALLKHNNNRLRTAAELGISRMSLYKKLYKYGLINS